MQIKVGKNIIIFIYKLFDNTFTKNVAFLLWTDFHNKFSNFVKNCIKVNMILILLFYILNPSDLTSIKEHGSLHSILDTLLVALHPMYPP